MTSNIAPAPFNDERADLILRSSDDVNFRTFRGLIYLSSTVLSDKLSAILRDHASEGTPPPLPVLPMPENAMILEKLLRLLCPSVNPYRDSTTLAEVRQLLQSTQAYKMELAYTTMCIRLREGFLDADPAGVYAVACLCNLAEEAREAADRLLRVPENALDTPEWGYLTALSYLRLLRFRRGDGKEPLQWAIEATPPSTTERLGKQENVAKYVPTIATYPFDGTKYWSAILVSAKHVQFRVSKEILMIASKVFKDRFFIPQLPNTSGKFPTIYVTEDSSILECLLCICYPMPDPSTENLDIVKAMISVGDKYGIPAVIEWAGRELVRHSAEQPLRAYAIARSSDLQAEAKAVAISALSYTMQELETMSEIPELQHLPASVISSLFAYHKNCSMAVVSLTSDYQWVPNDRKYCRWAECFSCGMNIRIAGGAETRVTKNWSAYMARARYILEARPGASVTAAVEFLPMSPISTCTASCPGCTKVYMENSEFCKLFAKQICNTVSEISL